MEPHRYIREQLANALIETSGPDRITGEYRCWISDPARMVIGYAVASSREGARAIAIESTATS